MLSNRPFSSIFIAAALFSGLLFSASQKVCAEDNGISVGQLKFGSQTNDKWLKVDMKSMRSAANSRRISGSSPTIGLGASSAVRSSTIYASSNTVRPHISTDAAGKPIYPNAKTRVRNTKLLTAAGIAMNRAHAHSTGSCWRYVKSALLKAEVIDSYPKTGYAKQAASELVENYGFVRTTVSNPFSAPVGSVLVYGGQGAGHIEIRTINGFVSDFVSAKPSSRPLIGVFVKQ